MKIKLIAHVVSISILLLLSPAYSVSGGSWVPTNGPGHITFVRYDITQSPGELRVELRDPNGTILPAYIYTFDPSSSIMLSRANAFYSALLAAQASGTGILLYLMTSNNQINAIQVGN